MGTRTTATMTAMLPSPPIGWGMVAKATFTTDRGASKRQNKTIDLKKLKGQVNDDIQQRTTTTTTTPTTNQQSTAWEVRMTMVVDAVAAH